MSPKRFNQPTASSSDEDEVETSTREEGSSSSDEEVDVSSKTPAAVKTKPVAVVAEKQVSDSESESEEETDSDSESEPEKKDEAVKKSVKHVTEVKDSVVKDQDSKKVKTSEKSVAKRSREKDEGASTDAAKRAKKVSGEEEEKKSGGGEETKKTYFQRVWNEDDEIVLLQGLIDYKNDTGANPYEDKNGVYHSVKESISFDVSKVQFTEKLRSLKRKYENNLGKAKKGKESTFVKPHDRKTFELSNFIWGADGMALESAVKSNENSKKSGPNGKKCEDEVTVKREVSLLDTFAKSSLVKSLARFGVDELAAQQGFSKIASEDKKRLEEQWKALQVKEFEFYSQKSGFLHEVMTKIAEAFGSNN